jgi:hypothetical protein
MVRCARIAHLSAIFLLFFFVIFSQAMLEMVRPDRSLIVDPVLPECEYLLQSLLPLCTDKGAPAFAPGAADVMA